MSWGSIHPVEFRGSAGSRERTLPAREVEENYREGYKGLHVLLSRTQAEQLSRSKKKFLATSLLADLCSPGL